MSVSDRIGKLTPEQRALLRSRLQRKYVEGAAEGAIPRRPDPGSYPLSFAQERLWFLDQLEPGPLYNDYTAYRFTGPLDPALMEHGFNEVVRRHEALRATFPAVEGRPLQVVLRDLWVPLPVVDLSALPAAGATAEIGRVSAREVQRPFDLAAGPLVRGLVLRLDAADHLVVLNMHHIVCDGWSAGILNRELTTVYRSLVEGRPWQLPELPIQYADYAHWQRQWLRGALGPQLAYWKERLAGAATVLELPTDRPRPKVRTGRGARYYLKLSKQVALGLQDLAQRQGVTMFMAQLAGLAALLHRYTGQEDLLIGTPIAGRNRVEVEGLIGFFVNTLVLRTDLGGDPDVHRLLARVRETVVGAFAHQDLPFEKLVEEVQPERDLAYTPLFQVMFASQVPLTAGGGAAAAPFAAGGIAMTGVPLDNHTTKFDLVVHFWDEPAGFGGWVEYDTGLFDPATIVRLIGHLETLLVGAVTDPDRRVSELPLLTEAERAQTLREWNDSRVEHPAGDTLYGLFAAAAERTPDAVALVWGGEHLTYAAARRRAEGLARRLAALGVGPDSPVGICVERSPVMPLAVLAALAAGGAYVPLDPAYPADRLAFMLADARARVLLTEPALADALPAEHRRDAAVVLLDEAGQGLDPVPSMGSTVVASGPGHMVYVIYTSGTTGRPKGIGLPQRTLVNLMHWQSASLIGGRRSLGFASFSFDVFCEELFGAVTTGGTLCLAPEAARHDPAELAQLVAEERIEEAILPVVVLQQLAEQCAGRAAALESLAWVTTTGEAMQLTPAVARLFARLREGGGGPSLHNFYGPAEAHVVTAHTLAGEPGTWPMYPPIGRPIANARIHLLDRGGQPVPIGVPGELHIGGLCLARGYAHQPALTAARFVPGPLAEEPGERLYRTGDLARRRTDGTLEFLGRIDHQVKIRGFRIEPGEIEQALARHPAVRETVVLARDDGPRGKHLVAYVVAEPGREGALAADELRAFLGASLPDYMIPAVFVRRTALPLTPNGKVDRRALLRDGMPEEGRIETERPFVPPRDPLEEALAALWAEVLGVERIGVHDDFFGLGGHSLLATQLLSRVRRTLEVDLPLRELFEGPTVAALAVRARAARGAATLPLPPLEPVPRALRELGVPLSFAQQRLWFLDRLQPGSRAYNIAMGLALSGPLDVPALAASLAEIVRRHETLRTAFRETGGEPFQVVSPPAPLALPRIDLTALPEPARQAEAHRLAAAEAGRPFDLERGPLFRVRLLVLGGDEHALLATLHHIVTDGWSMDVLVRELAALYGAFIERRASPLPELPVQYGDYAVWQRRWLTGEALATQLGSWRERLSGLVPLDLPADRPRPPVRSLRGAALSVVLPPVVSAALGVLGRRYGATLFMTTLAAFQALLSRSSGAEDVAVGTPVAGRTWVEIEGLIGFFVNTLVMRTDLSGDPSVPDLLGRVREVTLGAQSHAEVPFERLVEELETERDPSRTPLFQVMFTLQQNTSAADGAGLPGLAARPLAAGSGAAKFDLTLSLVEGPAGLLVGFEYATDLFDAATMVRWAERFRMLLEGIVAHPEARLSELPLLPDAERAQVLVEWSGGTRPYPRERTLPALFGEQAARVPEAVALSWGDERLTYGELDRWSNRIAHRLRRLGVGPESRVGVCLERSPELVAAFLGILKAGGAYVPLDPAAPAERQHFMMADAGIELLLTSGRLFENPVPGVRFVHLDRDAEALAAQPWTAPSAVGWPESLAYVMYTSGSTGEPKGVAVTQRGVVRLVRESGFAELGPEEVFLQLAPVGFDASTLELWAPLLNGGRLALPPPGNPTLEDLGRAIARHGVTTLWLTAGLFHLMVDERLEDLAPLRQLLAGGDVLSPLHVWRVLTGLPGVTLINGYGPTENTTFTCCHRMGGPGEAGSPVPIGRPIGNTRVYVVDGWLHPAPAGTPGELWTGGDGLARGYLGRPELTAERFVPDPWSGEPGGRLYRTGDLARWRPDGTLEFLGRLDAQVKIRGFRIEPGEIEAVLARHPGVLEAAVVAREEPGGKRLVACVVSTGEPAPTAGELRAFLAGLLPDFMVPASFVDLPALPLTANGKVDRRALEWLSPEPERLEALGGASGPRTVVEEVLAGIWCEVLGLERVGVEESFFELGGHSLLATQVVSRVRGAFGFEVPLADLFEAPTVAGLAERVELAQGALLGRPTAPPLVPVPRRADERLPLSFAQQRLWFIDQWSPGSAAYNVPAALRLEGRLQVAALAGALAEIARRHESLRTTFASADGEPWQLVHAARDLPLPLVDLTALAPAGREVEAARLAGSEAARPFDLAHGPVFRVTLLRLGEEAHVLIANLHHIVADGWSMGVLTREVTALYAAFLAREPSPLAELPVQYADYAVWQRSWLTGEVLAAELGAWRERLSGLVPLDLPADRPRPPVRSLRGATLPLGIPPDLTTALVTLSRRHGATLFMTSLAAFQALLARSSGREDLAVGTPVAGRTRVEIEGLIGFFVNTLVLRVDLSDDPSFSALLGRVRETSLFAHAHQEVPFERLVEELEPERDLSRTPLFQVMFALQNAPQGTLALPGLALSPVAADSGTAKFDLMLTLVEAAGGLFGGFEYAMDLFDVATVQRFAERFQVLLAGISADPETRLSDLPVLPEAERTQVLVDWSGCARPYPADRTIAELFSEQAARAPESAALSWDDGRLTYGELDRWSNRIAHLLLKLGVGPESRVGVCLERSPELVASLLGILKAGGAYVPLDPGAPAERQRFMLADAGVELLLTSPGLVERATAGVRIVHLDREAEALAAQPWTAPVATGWPDALAYVMYTSGSTGEPKGVGVTQRGVVRLVRESGFAELGPEEVFLQLAPVGFDASTLELWAPLLNGGRLALPPPGNLALEELGRVIARHGVTTLWLTAGLFHLMVDERLADLAPIRQLLAGGDVLSPSHVRRALTGLPGVTLINGYGPTENTTFTCCHRMGGLGEAGSPVPIGRPIGNTRVYVVGGWSGPAPVGSPGELWTGGAGLARGYLGRPDLTAERFVPDPWSGEPGGRLYRTGDQARWRPDGTLEFLGRLDTQVKIRGFRIEPGEIEAALARHPGVRESAVVARDEPGGKRLVACVVPAGEPTPALAAAGELKAFLAALLPDHMVPSVFVELPALPLTANGKVDRRVLARLSPAPERLDGPGESGAPRSLVEEVLSTIWCAVLGRESVGVEESFFELGGHSLLATQVVSRIRSVFDLELPLADLFEAPTLRALAERVELAQGALLGRPAAPPLVPVPRRADGRLPLSFAQQRLWFIDKWSPGSAAYNVPAALRLEGRLQVAALAGALAEIARRHESLRTTFASVDGEPWQLVHAAGDLPLPLVDLTALAPAGREGEAARLAGTEAARPFDLACGPVFRVTLLRLGEEAHVLIANLHHIVADGWSMGVLTGELTALYAAFLAGEPSPLPELPVQYADYAKWQRSWLVGEVLAAELGAWRKRLSGLVPLDLPADRPRPPVRSLRGATLPLAIPPDLATALVTLSRRHGATLFMTSLAAFQALLSRSSGRKDLTVGTPVAGRTRVEIEDLIGFFVNTLVLRADLAGDPSFSELLGRVREAALFAHAHQEVPFERLVEELEPERDLSRTPLFQVMFALQNAPQGTLALPGLALSPVAADSGTAKFDLMLTLVEAAGGLFGGLEYATDLFDVATIQRYAERFGVLLEGVAADPEAHLSELPLLPAAEWRQVVVEWSGGGAVQGQDRCLHELFAEQAARTPDAVALIAGERWLTYEELDAAANRLAHHLRSLGVGPEVLVGLGVERSAEMVIALLGILKAGGAYVPFDGSQPVERLAMILEDSGVAVLLTQESLRASLPPCRAALVDLDGEREAITTCSATAPLPVARPENLAYTIFTSGSTGRPKGVAIAHRSASALIRWAAEAFSEEELAGVLAATSIGFDLSVFELFAPLSCGGTVILAADALALADLPEAGRVTLVNTVPSAMAELVRMGAIPPSARTVNLAGEPLHNSLAQRIYEQCPGVARVLNLYGPTEDTTYSTGAEVARGTAREPAIGQPIAGGRAFIVDAWLRPSPVGVPGELVLGGAGLARGYLGRPELTAERFVPDPFGREPGARLYRTGDLARFRPDGEIEFLGRLDHQVKLRGFRIELGEIEAVLGGHAGVREAVVIVREDAPDDRRLVAYVVPGVDPDLATDELRAFVAARLPASMIPAAFVTLPALPLTPNGKVDRRALPAPTARPPAESPSDPRTPIEEVLAGFWCEILGVERVGPGDGFFALGGHSLLATRVVSRVRQAFGVELPLRDLFEAPTLAALAARVEVARGARAALPVPPLERAVRRPGERLPLSFAQQRLWFLDLLEPGSPAYNIPGALRAAGELDIPALIGSLSEIVRRHESLRTTFSSVGGEPFQVVAPLAPFALPMVDLTALPAAARGGEGQRLAATDAARPFDLGRGPLLRVALLRLGVRDHAVLINMHHIVSDAWSLGVFVGELAALYPAFQESRPSPLPEPTLQYADFAAWQRAWLTGDALAGQLAYWRRQLAGAPPVLALPTDRPRTASADRRSASRWHAIAPGRAEAIRALGRREGATLFMTLLAAFDMVLCRWSGQTDVSVGSPIAGRDRLELEGLIGFFVNTLVLRAELAGDPTCEAVLARVRAAALDAYANQDLPFERLVEELQPERSREHTPLFQVMFGLQNAPQTSIALPGLELEPFAAGPPSNKFDLNLSVSEAGGLVLSLSYDREIFDAPTIDRLLGRLEALLGVMTTDPERRLSELPLLAAAEEHQVLVEWGRGPARPAAGFCVHELIESWAARTPESLALVFEEERLTYGELARRSGELARRLVRLGVGPETRVGLAAERSSAMIVAMLGVLRAGGAYVPLDPAFPAARLIGMAEDAGVAVVLAEERLWDLFAERGFGVLGLAAGEPEKETVALPEPDPESLAYVLFTSGSTGRPKGVAVEHRQLANYTAAVLERLELPGPASFATVSTLSADLGNTSIFAALASGGALHVLSVERVADPAAFGEHMARSHVDCLKIVPSHLKALLGSAPEPAAVLPRQRLVLGGEALPWALVEQVRELAPQCVVLNHYGPTESTVGVLVHRVGARGAHGGATVPLGRPLANVRAVVLDGWGWPVPAGAPGELCLGGAGLARGYLGRPDLTAERFVPDLWSGEPGGRLYRTGDRARFLPDGTVEFLGRLDAQVKVRGFRIELGEVEAALARHPSLAAAAVVAREGAGGQRLVACVVPSGEPWPVAGELRGFLGASLPDYMIPGAFVSLPALPLTANGKVDRRALERLELEPESTGGAGLPRTLVEEVLAGIWCEVLGRERVGVEESFFELGGHSLLATQVVSRMREAFRVELPLADLFEAPTVAGLSARVELAQGAFSGRPAPPPLVPLSRRPGERLPLSFAQQRLWFIDQWSPGLAAYNIPLALRLEGRLHVAALTGALGEVVRRHESLRTTFESVDGEPWQLVHPAGERALPVVDLSALLPWEREMEAARLVAAEASRPFDLARGPVFRVTLVRLGQESHVLAANLHHIASDGWSRGVLTRELTVLYAALSAGEPSPLPELPVQYADYARWQRSWLAGEVLEREVSAWRERLAGLEPLDLPADRPRLLERSLRGATQPLVLPAELATALTALGRRRGGATLFMVLLAAFDVLLGRLAGRDDVTVGTPVAGRTRVELEGLIGFFINTLVLRADLSGDPSFTELLARVRETSLFAHAHQEVPFERLVEELEPERDPSRTPLFQVMLVVQNAPQGELALPGLALSPVAADSGTAKFDLTLALMEGAGGLLGGFEYALDLFDATTVLRLAERFQVLLAGIAANPEARLSDLPVLPEAERTQVLVDWSGCARPYPADRTIAELFSEQAARAPESAALSWDDGRLTYGELDRWSNRIAHLLLKLGVGPESRVGVCLERSPELVASLLGILKAGGAYVPLDPGAPAERQRFMLADAGVELLLTSPGLVERATAGVRIVHLDREAEALAAQPWTAPVATGWPDALAYVMYTSGSTGEPKGVGVTQRGVVRLVRESGFAELGPEEVFLQLAPVGFDASTLELWAPLLNGGRLALPPPGNLALEELGRAIARHGVTTLWLTAGLFHLMVDERLADLAPLRQLLAGGDVLSPPHVRRALAGLPGVTLINGYGPTENTTFTCCHLMGGLGEAGSPVPIGRPIGNTRVYVVGGWSGPAPVGSPGELWTGGAGLARGYLGRPDLTAERFVPDPWSGEPGGRLYRTGDQAWWRPDGTLEFLGRLDAQVKIRGFRIEPGEIEAALARHPGVRESAVVARDEPGGKRLVACVVPAGEPTPAAGELKAFLAALLPDHMIPSVFVELPALPLTANGKVDRQALSRLSPAPERLDGPGESSAPRSLVEEVLSTIWCAVLGRESVGVEESFFELGGHSLLATQVVSRIRSAFGLELALADLFEAPTLRALAERVELAQGTLLGRPAAPPLVPAPRRAGERLPLSFAQQRLWFIDQWSPGSAAYNIPLALRLEGRLHVMALAGALAEIVRRHESLRTTFELVDGEPWQLAHPAGDLGLPVVDLSVLSPAGREVEAARLSGAEAARPFDLARGPVLRMTLLRLGEETHVLVANVHHIVADGWSMGVLTQELTALYAAFMAGEPSPLPELPVQYADYAAWQRSWLAGEVLETELVAWRERLAGLPPLDLPSDRPRPPVRSLSGATLPLALSPELSAELSALGRHHGATLFMTLLAAFQVLLSRTSGQADVAVGTPVAGRTRVEVEGLIGFFVNTLVLRADLSDDPSFSELLARAREASLFAHAHQEVPFERLVEVLDPERDPSRTPLFQVMLSLQNAPQGELALPGLALSPVAADSGTSKFDLTLALMEGAGGLFGGLQYATDLFDAATIQRYAERFRVLLEGVAADPEAHLSELPLLPAAEWRQVVVEWSGGGAVQGQDRCLHELFAEQAARTPGAVALIASERRLTYEELDAAANRLAHHLRSLGVGPEVLVGLGVERSAEMVIGLLGILKAGGAYVPFDRSQPAERLAMILEDSGVAVLLTQESLRASLPPCRAALVDLDGEREAIAACSTAAPPPVARPENLAYTIFTSGSTGRPKGVAIAHQSASTLVRWAAEAFSDEEIAGVLAATSIGFDLSVFELFAPLSRGGTVILAADALALADLPQAGRVTLVNTVPSAMAELVRMGAIPPSVRTVNLAGEPLHNSLAQRIYEQCPGVSRVVNLYGPTEDTTYSTGAEVARGDAREPAIGRPIAGGRAFVVDAWLRPSPVGAPGELVLGGAGLARGYVGRPELTAERFVPDPFGREPGARLYRTGDLARFRADGEIEFLGRLDHQAKLRGFRIELGEIEAVLGRHPGVREVVVVVREDAPDDRRLVAYLVPEADPTPDPDDLKALAAAYLPFYMVPSAFVVLPALPLTPNGKVDRAALARLAPAAPAAGGKSSVPPRDALELELVHIWEELLRVRPIGVRDGFFDLGGHSLLSVALMARVRERFGKELPLATLFRAATVESLAAALRESGLPGSPSPLVAIQPKGGRRPFVGVHPVGGGVFCYAGLARLLDPDQPFYAFQAPGLDGEAVPSPGTVEEMAERYLEHLGEAQPHGPYFLGGWSMGGLVAFEMARRLAERGEQVALLALIDTMAPGAAGSAVLDEASVMARFARDLAGLLGRSLPHDVVESLHGLATEPALRHLLELARGADLLPPGIDLPGARRLFETFRRNYEAARGYTGAAYPGRVVLLKAEGPQAASADPTFGWGRLAAEVEVHRVAGDHYSLLLPPRVEELAGLLGHLLEAARA